MPMFQKKEKANDPEKLTNGNLFAYGMGALPGNMTTQLRSNYQLSFMTDIAKINPAIAGVLMTIMVIWDAINDPVIAVLADRTNTKKMGKYRPWMFWGSILLGIITILCFMNPGFTGGANVAYFFLVMFIYCWVQTMFMVPWQALNSVMSADPHQRNRLLTYRQLFGTGSAIVVSIIVMPIVNGAATEATGWLTIAGIVAICDVIGGLACCVGVKKKDYYNSLPVPERFSWKEQLHIVVKNKPMLLAAGAYGTLFLMMNTINAANIYFYRIALGNTDIIALSGLVSLVFSIGVIPFVPGILKKMEKRTMAMLGLGIYMIQPIGYLVMRGSLLSDSYEYTSGMLIIFLVLISFGAFGNIVANVAIVSFIMDVVDYTEWKFHTSQAAFVNSAVTLLKKLSGSISTLVVGIALSAVGYVNYTIVTPELKAMVVDICIWPLLVMGILCFIMLKVYPLHGEFNTKMREELKERRAQQNA